MGGVYEIRGEVLNNRLALKVIRPEFTNSKAIRARFQREARIQSQLDHESIVKVFELIEHDQNLCIVMELVDAPTLRDRLESGPLPPQEAREVVMELAEALLVAHEAGIVHRDLKPDNVFAWKDRRGRVRCKLTDFGIAKHAEVNTDVGPSLTRSGAFIGTMAYASPEQITHEREVDLLSDLYSLGVVLWEMLAGVSPYDNHTSAWAIQTAVVQEDLPDLPLSLIHI